MGDSIYEKQMKWRKAIEKKAEATRDKNALNSDREYTFTPNVNQANPPTHNPVPASFGAYSIKNKPLQNHGASTGDKALRAKRADKRLDDARRQPPLSAESLATGNGGHIQDTQQRGPHNSKDSHHQHQLHQPSKGAHTSNSSNRTSPNGATAALSGSGQGTGEGQGRLFTASTAGENQSVNSGNSSSSDDCSDRSDEQPIVELLERERKQWQLEREKLVQCIHLQQLELTKRSQAAHERAVDIAREFARVIDGFEERLVHVESSVQQEVVSLKTVAEQIHGDMKDYREFRSKVATHTNGSVKQGSGSQQT